METRYLADGVRYATMNAAELRDTFLVTSLFTPGEIRLALLRGRPRGDRLRRARGHPWACRRPTSCGRRSSASAARWES